MPSFSRSLEQALHRALALAGERRHEYATLDDLKRWAADPAVPAVSDELVANVGRSHATGQRAALTAVGV